ncbi:hypothetical protein ASE59_02330 [Sphingomonas sp. Leaf10]|nr:hypothetical protein ASE59_02330 [Sphingomonas sp. Leaf10]
MLRAPALVQWPAGPICCHVLDLLPQFLRHDAQFGHFNRDSLLSGVDPGDAATGLGIAPHVQAVVEVPPGVNRVVQHPQTPSPRSGDGGCPPVAAARCRDTIGVQPLGNRLRTATGGIFAIDAQDDVGLLRDDPPDTAIELAIRSDRGHDLIAVGEAAWHSTARDRPALTAPDLFRQLLQEQSRHRALQPDMKLRHVTFGQRVNADVRELETLIDRRDIGLVAGDPIDRLRTDDIERSGGRIRQHRGHPGPPVGCAGDGDVGIDAGDFPAFAFCTCRAAGNLVFGRMGGLKLGREAGVNGAAGHGRLRDG